MHRKVLCVAAVLFGALAMVPGESSGQQKNQQKNKAVPATDQDYYIIQNQKAQSLTGQILAFDDANHTVSVRIDFPEWVPNPKYKPNAGAQHALMHDYNQLMQDQAKMANARNANQAAQFYNKMMNLQNRIATEMQRAANGNGQAPFMKIEHLKDFDFDMSQTVTYRKMFLLQEYDDTGNLKTLSKEKMTELRGTNNPKGSYSATASELHPGQGVWVYLKVPKKTETDAAASSAASKTKEDKEDKDVKDPKDAKDPKEAKVPHPTVKMLVVHTDGSLAPTTKDPPPKKKN